MKTLHPVAMACWLLSGVVVAITGSPLTWVILILASVGVAMLSGDRRTFRLAILVSITTIVMRVILFGLTGHAPGTVLFVMPGFRLPAVLGGLLIGGPVHLEPVLIAMTEGSKLAAMVCLFGAAISSIGISGLTKLFPASFGEGAVVFNVAMSAVPQLASTMTDADESLRSRGVPRYRRIPRLFLPALAVSLERAVTLAISMESRGFGQRSASRAGSIPRMLGLLLGTAGAGGAAAGAGSWGYPVAAVGAALIGTSIPWRSVGRSRDSFRQQLIARPDVIVITAAISGAMLAIFADASMSPIAAAMASAPVWVRLGDRP